MFDKEKKKTYLVFAVPTATLNERLKLDFRSHHFDFFIP